MTVFLIKISVILRHTNLKRKSSVLIARSLRFVVFFNCFYTDVVKLLIKAGAEVNSKNYDGNTALMRSAFHGHANVAKLLIKAGADVNAKNNDGKPAADMVKEREENNK